MLNFKRIVLEIFRCKRSIQCGCSLFYYHPTQIFGKILRLITLKNRDDLWLHYSVESLQKIFLRTAPLSASDII